jgi:hypothetical protein
MEITGGMTFLGGMTVTQQPPIYLMGLLSQTGSNYATPISITVDSSGNIYTLIDDQYSTTFGIILIKYSSSGTIQWQKNLTNGRQLNGQDKGGVTTDSSGNVYITTVQRGADGYDYMVTAKYDSSGNLQWQRQLYNMIGMNIVADSSGNVYAVGFGSGVTTGQGSNGQIVKYDTSGTLQWQKMLSLSGNYSEYPYGVALDGSNNVYVSMYGNTSGNDVTYIVKLDSSGATQWQRQVSKTSINVYAYNIAVTSAGDIYLAGRYQQVVSGQTAMLIVKYNTSGTIQWQKDLKQNGNNRAMYAVSCAVDSSGYLYITGVETQDSDGTGNALVCQYDSNGTLVWQRRLYKTNSSTYVNGKAIQVDNNGYIYVMTQTGAVTNNATLFAKLPTDGTKTGAYTVGGISFTYGTPSVSCTAGTGSATDSASSLTNSTSTTTASTSTMTSGTGTAISAVTII